MYKVTIQDETSITVFNEISAIKSPSPFVVEVFRRTGEPLPEHVIIGTNHYVGFIISTPGNDFIKFFKTNKRISDINAIDFFSLKPSIVELYPNTHPISFYHMVAQTAFGESNGLIVNSGTA